MSNTDELNNQGDYISGAVGDDGKEIVVGKNINTQRTEDNRRKDDNRRQDTSNNFNFQNSSEPLLQVYWAIQNIQNGLTEFRQEQRQSIGSISADLKVFNGRLSSVENGLTEQRRDIELMKENGRRRDEILDAIKNKVETPPVIMATATSLSPMQFWLFLAILVLVGVVIVIIGMVLMRGV